MTVISYCPDCRRPLYCTAVRWTDTRALVRIECSRCGTKHEVWRDFVLPLESGESRACS